MKYFLLIAFSVYSQFAFCERLILSLAEQILLPLPPSYQIHIGNKELVMIQKKEKHFSLLARKEGHTRLIADNKQYEIFIFKKEKKEQALLLDLIIKKFWGLKWSLSDNNLFQITGKLNRLYDWVELAKIAKSHNIFYEFKAIPGEDLKPQIHNYFKNLFKNKHPLEINWNKLPLTYFPKGANKQNYETLLNFFGLSLQEDPFWLSKSPFIEIEIALVEQLSTSSFSFGGLSDSKSFLNSFSSLLAFLNFLKSSGKGKTLHHSSIVGQSGKKILMQSGGQLPFYNYDFKNEQKNSNWKSYGLTLNILPILDKKNQIEIEIKTQISEPLSLGSGLVPIKNQSLESKVLLKDKEILKIFQLQKKTQGIQFQGQLGFLLPKTNSLLHGKNKQETLQALFIQAKIIQSNQQALKTKKAFYELF